MKQLVTLILLGICLSLPTLAVSNEGEYGPAWSPDGQYIAYHKNNDSIFWDIMLKNVKTGEVIQITKNQTYDTGASWSPDSQKIAFSSSMDGNRDIYIYHLKTGKTKRVIQHEAMDNQASWSPNGRKLAFLSRRDGLSQLYLYDFESKQTERLTTTPLDIFHPDWSDDGRGLVFDQKVGKQSQIFFVDAKSKQVTSLYKGKGSNIAASLRSKKLTFSSNRNGNWDIYQVDLESRNDTAIVSSPLDEMKGKWDKQHNYLAFSKSDEQGVFHVTTLSKENLFNQEKIITPIID